jgi:WD40 repeat protein/transcriptional regulator with XRE-family HTH domain
MSDAAPEPHHPDPSTFTTAAEWSAGLQRLRERSGLSVRDLARAAGASSSTVGGYVSGRHLPTIAATDVVEKVLEAVGVDDTDRRTWLDALNRLRRNASVTRSTRTTAPWKGLAGYGLDDAGWFCGREGPTDRLVAAVKAAPRLPVLLVGASGSGKSSLLHAGLAARLADEGTLVLSRTPGDAPAQAVHELAKAADDPDGDPRTLVVVDQLEELWTSGASDVEWRLAVDRLVALAGRPGVTVVGALRADFYARALASEPLAEALQDHQVLVGPMTRAELVRAVTEPAARARVDVEPGFVDVLLRDVGVGRQGGDGAHDPGALPLLSFALLQTWQRHPDGLTVAGYLESGGLAGAIAAEAERVHDGLGTHERELARRLFTRLVAVSDDAPDARRRLTHADVDALDAADDPGRGAGVADVVEAFVAARLLTAGETHVEITHEALIGAWPRLRGWLDADRAGLVLQRGLSDDAAAWDRAGRDHERLARGARLEALREWASGAATPPALTKVEQEFLDASALRAAQERARRRRRSRQLQILSGGLAAALVAVLALAGYALAVRSDAEDARDLALSRQLAEAANRVRATDPSFGAQLAVLADRTASTVESRSALLDAAALPLARRLDGPGGIASVAASGDSRLVAAVGADGGLRLWRSEPGDPATSVPRRVATVAAAYAAKDDPALYAVAVSSDGGTVVTGGRGGAIRLWDATDPAGPVAGQRLDTKGLTTYGLAIGPAGLLVAALAGPDPSAPTSGVEVGRLAVWQLDGAAATPVAGPLDGFFAVDGNALCVALDRTGGVVAVGTSSGAVQRFSIEEGTVARAGRTLAEATGDIVSVAFAPDGRTLAAASKDRRVHLWTLSGPGGDPVPADPADPATGHRTLEAAQSWVNAVAFSPDGAMLAAGGSDSRLRLYDTAGWAPLAELGSPGPVTAAAFAADGAALLTTAADGIVRQWPVPLPQAGIAGGRTFVLSRLADGNLLAMTSGNSARFLDVSTPFAGVPLSPSFGSPGTATNPDGERFAGTLAAAPAVRRMAAGGALGTVWVFDLPPGRPGPLTPSGVFRPHTKLVEAAAMTPDGRRLVTSSDDGTLALSDVSDPANPRTLGANLDTGIGYALAAAPSGGIVAAGRGTAGGLDLWRADGPALVKLASAPADGGPDLQVYGLAFTPDGRTLAVGAADRTVRFLDVADPAHPRWTGTVLTAPGDYVWGVQFDGSGKRLAVVSQDGVVRVYDLPDLARPRPFAVLAAPGLVPMYSVSLRPDGLQVSAGGAPEAVYTWSLDPAEARARICALAGDPVSRQEWNRYVPSVPYQQVCAR